MISVEEALSRVLSHVTVLMTSRETPQSYRNTLNLPSLAITDRGSVLLCYP